jgi:hypothetical protein
MPARTDSPLPPGRLEERFAAKHPLYSPDDSPAGGQAAARAIDAALRSAEIPPGSSPRPAARKT